MVRRDSTRRMAIRDSQPEVSVPGPSGSDAKQGTVVSFQQYIVSTVGGKPYKRSQDVWRLNEAMRELLDDGWPAFIRSSVYPNHSIEFRRGPAGELITIPAEGASELWVRQVLKEVRL